jgi:hypothetical protein
MEHFVHRPCWYFTFLSAGNVFRRHPVRVAESCVSSCYSVCVWKLMGVGGGGGGERSQYDERKESVGLIQYISFTCFTFNFQLCGSNNFLHGRADQKTSDLVIFKDHFVMTWGDRPPGQLWMMYMLECPVHTQVLDKNRWLRSPAFGLFYRFTGGFLYAFSGSKYILNIIYLKGNSSCDPIPFNVG